MTHRLAIVASHVIQYQDPLFKLLAADPAIDLEVLYCSGAGAKTYHDRDMAATMRWDIELLQGYRYRILRNLARDTNAGFWRHVNPGLATALARGRYDAVIFMLGWGSFSAIIGIATCALLRIPFFLYGDSSFPPPEATPRARLRARVLRGLFGLATGFMVSGKLNADYYAHYGADRRRFFLLPWAVDNERFARMGAFAPGEHEAFRTRLGIEPGRMVIVFSGKLVERKDPMTLLRAFARMEHRDKAALVLLGDGVLRPQLEEFVREHGLRGAHFAGFVNQTELPRFYAASDVFALPSAYEPRGAVINEAMACGLPVIVTDRCGSIGDIVRDGENAFVFPAGDDAVLAAMLDRLAADPVLRARMAARSIELIGEWTFARGVEGVKEMLEWTRSR